MVFVTAHDQYAIEAFEVNALDYLLKPVRAARLAAALAKARATGAVQRERGRPRPRRRPGRCRALPLGRASAGKILLVPVAEIVYLKAELKYVTVRTADREHLLEESLASLEQEFAGHLRAHPPLVPGRAPARCAASSA